MRQALDLAIDRDVLNQVIGEGMFQPAHQPFPPASFAFNKAVEHTGRDPKKAQALLKEAGLDRVRFEITFGNNTTMQQVFELIQAMGAEAGFDITLRPVEFASLQSSLARGDFVVGQSGWSGRVDPSGNIHQYLSCKGNLNDGKFCDPAVDKLLNDARRGRSGQAPRHVRPGAGRAGRAAPHHLSLLPALDLRRAEEGGRLRALSRRADPP